MLIRCAMFVIAIVLGLTVSGCGGGSDDHPGTGSGATDASVSTGSNAVEDLAIGDIRNDQLRLMVLPRAELGPAYATFEPDPGNGYFTNENAIDNDECETSRAAADVERYGRRMGYDQGYSSDAARSARTGTFRVDTSVEVYGDASGALKSELEDLKQRVGVACNAFTLVAVSEFPPVGLTGNVYGWTFVGEQLTTTGERLRFFATTVFILRGHLSYGAGVASFDDSDHSNEVVALARKLDEQVNAVLGDHASPDQDAVASNESVPLLAAQSLRLGDMPPGFTLTISTLYTLADVIASTRESGQGDPETARRRYQSWGFVAGNDREYSTDEATGLQDIDVEVWLLDSEAGADNAFIDGALLHSNPDVQAQEIAGFQAYGDESVAFSLVLAGGASGAADVEGYEIMMRVNRHLALLRATGNAGSINAANQTQISSLAAALESRLRG